MMKKCLLLCLLMTVFNFSYSQNILTITSDQLKTTNLIFAEHYKLSKTVPLLNSKINNLELINKSWERTDSINNILLLQYKDTIEYKNKSINNLNKSLKVKDKIITYGASGSLIAILLCLLLK